MADETAVLEQAPPQANYGDFLKSRGTKVETPKPEVVDQEVIDIDPARAGDPANVSPDGGNVSKSAEDTGTSDDTQDDDKPSFSQQAFDRLVKQRQRAREEAKELRLQLAEKSKPVPVEVPRETVAPITQQARDWFADNPKDPAPKEENFKTWQEYQDARADWRANRTWQKNNYEAQQRETQQAFQREQDELKTGYQTRLSTFKERDEIDALVGKGAPKENLQIPDLARDFIFASEAGPKVFLQLLKSDEDYQKVASARHPMKMLRALLAIESKFTSKALADESPATKQVTRAPKPPTVLNGNSAPPPETDPSKMNRQQWIAQREKQLVRH